MTGRKLSELADHYIRRIQCGESECNYRVKFPTELRMAEEYCIEVP